MKKFLLITSLFAITLFVYFGKRQMEKTDTAQVTSKDNKKSVFKGIFPDHSEANDSKNSGLNKVVSVKKKRNIRTSYHINNISEAKKEEKKLLKLYEDSSVDLKSKLVKIQSIRDDISNWYQENDIPEPKIVRMKPNYLFTLNLVLERPISELTDDSQVLEIGLDQVYLIKTFSESKDFQIIVDQNRFNTQVINLESLEKIYSNAPTLEYNNGIVYGKASSAPSIAQENLDNTN